MRRILLLLAVFLLGLVLGPFLSASVRAISTDKNVLALALLQARDAEDPRQAPRFDADQSIRDCGYTPESLFGTATPTSEEGREGAAWTPYGGYFDLVLRRMEDFSTEVQYRRAALLARQSSSLQLALLETCIRETPLANYCVGRVDEFFARAGAPSPFSLPEGMALPDESRANRTICTYLAGVAAQRRAAPAPR